MTKSEFWSNFKKNPKTGCLEWQRARLKSGGYGAVYFGGKLRRVHVLAWELANGPVPPGKCVLHKCDNPPCGRAEPGGRGHLFLGTRGDNARDCASKGRNRAQTRPEMTPRGDSHYSRIHPERLVRGERFWSAKLTAIKVSEIRRRNAAGESQRALAREFGVNQPTISEIVRRVIWKHVP